MKIKDIMSKAHCIDKSGRISEALDMMDKYHSRRLIVKHKDQVQGVITLRGICGTLGSRRKYNHPPTLFHVADAVSNDYSTLGPEDDAVAAIAALKDVNCVIVVDGELVGQVSTKDVIRHVTPDGILSSIMKIPVIAPPDARVSFIRKLMIDHGVSRVPILDGHTLVGIVSETDIAMALRGVKKHSPQARQDNNVESMIALDIMRTNVITGKPDMTIKVATQLMLDNDIGALPVLNEARNVVGMITRRDIVAAI